MKLYKILCIAVLLLCITNTYSQHLLCGKVVNQKGEALYPVNAKLKNAKIGAISNNEGEFCINTPLKAEIIVSFMGYETTVKKFAFTPQNKDTIILIVLNEKFIDLKAVEISSEKIELITKEKRIWITDYEFWNDNIITLNLDENNKKLSLISHNDSLVWETELSDGMRKSTRLYKDFLSNIYLLSDDSAFQITNRSESIYFFPAASIIDFNNLIMSSLGKCGDEIIYRMYGPHNKSVNYYLINQGKKGLLYSQIDVESERYCQDLYNGLNSNPSPSFAKHEGNMRIGTDYFNNIFYKKIMAQPIEIHLFKMEDCIYIFDHFKAKINIYNCDGKLLQVINTDYPKRKDIVAKKLIVAHNNKDVYALFLNDGLYSIQQIELKSGKLKGDEIKINKLFVERISIYENNIYFLYKLNEEDSRKRLYRMRL